MSRKTQLIWRLLTREPGGAILALATDGHLLLAGSASGAFLAERDASGWQPLALPRSWGRLELANLVTVAPWGDRYIATPSGLFRQQPNGTWQRCLEGGTIVAIRTTTEGNRRLVIVADQLDGILVSANAGTDWEPANAGLPQLVEVVDLVVSPQFERDRTVLLVAADGAFLSRSRRWSWHELESAPTSLECGALTTDEAGRLSLFLGGDAGLFRSRDRGRTWERLALPVEGSCSLLATDPTGRHLAAAIDRSIVRTADQGENWDCLPALPSHVLSLAVLDREHLVAGTLAHGCLVWDDRAGTWQERNQGLYGRLPVGIIARRSHELLVADYSGTVLHSPDGGSTWQRALLDRGIAQFAGGPTGPVFALALDTLLRSSDGHEWEPVRDIEELSESAWLLASDDGGTVCLVQYTLEPTLEPLVSLAFSRDSGATWQEHRTRAFALVQGAALAPDGRALAVLALRTGDLQPTLSLAFLPTEQWITHRWPEALPETSLVRLLWSAAGETLLAVVDTDVWLVRHPLERPRIARVGRLDAPASALGRAGSAGWFLASGTRLWHCASSGTLRALVPDGPEQTVIALTGDPTATGLAGYAADVGGSIWSFLAGETSR